MNAFLTKDHHNKQRLHALRGYARKEDRLLADPPINWLLIVLVCAMLFGIGVAVGMPEIVAGILQ